MTSKQILEKVLLLSPPVKELLDGLVPNRKEWAFIRAKQRVQELVGFVNPQQFDNLPLEDRMLMTSGRAYSVVLDAVAAKLRR